MVHTHRAQETNLAFKECSHAGRALWVIGGPWKIVDSNNLSGNVTIQARITGYGMISRIRNALSRDLMKYVNGATNLSAPEKQALLREAAAAIRCYREWIALSGAPANDHEADLAFQLDRFADGIEFHYEEETKAIAFEAIDTLRVLRLMMGIKQEILEDND